MQARTLRPLISHFSETFSASDGPEEGKLIGDLVHDLLGDTAAKDLRVFRAEEDGSIIGAVIFTRLTYPEDSHIVFLLSPMAVVPHRQRQGIGQALLTNALDALRAEGVQIAITCGDPNYYRQVGFAPITEHRARAPMPLSLPHGWLGLSLTEPQIPAIKGPSTCVRALNRSDVW